MKEKDLKQVAASSMVWVAVQKYIILGMTFFSSIILARLLTPYDYGCIGMLTIFISVSNTLIDSGFGSALLQKKRPTQEDYSTIFYWNIAVSTILYFVLFFAAPAIASFYKIPLLRDVLRVQGLVLFINAFKLIQSNQLRKQFRFKITSTVTIYSSFISIVTTIILAYLGFGVWALVAQNLLIAFLPMISFWIITKWRPLLCFSMKSFKELFNFGIFMLMTSVVDTFSRSIQGLLIGKFYSPSTLGYYSKAWTTEQLASNGISQVVSTVTYQLYAEVQDNLTVLANMIKRLTMSLAYVTFPLIITLIIIAKPLFIILYSERWLPSVSYFQVLAFAGFAICMSSVNLFAIAAIGKSRTMFTWNLLKRGFGISVIFLGLLLWGMRGLLLAAVATQWFMYLVNCWLVSKHIGYKMKTQAQNLAPIMILAAVSFVPSFLFGYFTNLNMYADGIIRMLIFLGLYFGLSAFLKLEAYEYAKSLIPVFFKKFKRGKKAKKE